MLKRVSGRVMTLRGHLQPFLDEHLKHLAVTKKCEEPTDGLTFSANASSCGTEHSHIVIRNFKLSNEVLNCTEAG